MNHDFRGNLYISDVDYTLLRSEKTLSRFSRKAIELLHSNNIPFTIATARSVYSLSNLLGNIEFKLPIVEFNGGYITNYQNKKPLRIFDIPMEISDKILEITEQINLYPSISTFDIEQEVFPPKNGNYAFDHYFEERRAMKDPRLRGKIPYEEIREKKILALTFMGKYDEMKELYHLLYNSEIQNSMQMHYYENKYTPGTYWITIHAKLSSKEHAIEELRKMTGMENHHLTVFGDDVNDLGMMRIANTSVAVSNAKDEVKELADIIIDSNDQDGVMKYILQREELETSEN